MTFLLYQWLNFIKKKLRKKFTIFKTNAAKKLMTTVRTLNQIHHYRSKEALSLLSRTFADKMTSNQPCIFKKEPSAVTHLGCDSSNDNDRLALFKESKAFRCTSVDNFK